MGGAGVMLAASLALALWLPNVLRPQTTLYQNSVVVEDQLTSNSWLQGYRHIQVVRATADCQAVAFFYVRQFEMGQSWSRSQDGCISARSSRPTQIGAEITRLVTYMDGDDVVTIINQEYDYSTLRRWISPSAWQDMIRGAF